MSLLITNSALYKPSPVTAAIMDNYFPKNAGKNPLVSERHIAHQNMIGNMAQVLLIESHLETMRPTDKARAEKNIAAMVAKLPLGWRTEKPSIKSLTGLVRAYIKVHGSISRRDCPEVTGLTTGCFDRAAAEFKRSGEYVVKKVKGRTVIYAGLSIKV